MCIVYGNYKTRIQIPDRHQQDTYKDIFPQGVLHRFRKMKVVKGIAKTPADNSLGSVSYCYTFAINGYLIHEIRDPSKSDALGNVHNMLII
jgi:hypothetical protein